MTDLPFTIERDPHGGRPYRVVGGEPQTGYVGEEEALLFEAVKERDNEVWRLRQEAQAEGQRSREFAEQAERAAEEAARCRARVAELEEALCGLQEEVNEYKRREEARGR
jgi:molecular chaperone GrpE (heat shock protein)